MPGKNQLTHVKEDNQIKSFLSLLSYDTSVILFDLDNTVGWPGTYLGSDQWFMKVFEYLGKSLTDKDHILTLAVAMYNEVQHHSTMEAVESKVIFLINCLKSIGYPVLAITARGNAIKETTHRQLLSIGLSFDDIIFCGGKSKGEELLKWIKNQQPEWKKVVMIDDKVKHLHRVAEALASLKIAFKGLRYSRMDAFFSQQDNCYRVHESLTKFSYFSERTTALLAPIMTAYSGQSIAHGSQF